MEGRVVGRRRAAKTLPKNPPANSATAMARPSVPHENPLFDFTGGVRDLGPRVATGMAVAARASCAPVGAAVRSLMGTVIRSWLPRADRRTFAGFTVK